MGYTMGKNLHLSRISNHQVLSTSIQYNSVELFKIKTNIHKNNVTHTENLFVLHHFQWGKSTLTLRRRSLANYIQHSSPQALFRPPEDLEGPI